MEVKSSLGVDFSALYIPCIYRAEFFRVLFSVQLEIGFDQSRCQRSDSFDE